MLLGKFQMTADCYGGSNVVYMLMLYSKCCINVPIGSRLNTWSGYIWNVPNLLLAGKWQVPSTRAYNVLKMFSLVSRHPCPQWEDVPESWSGPNSDTSGSQNQVHTTELTTIGGQTLPNHWGQGGLKTNKTSWVHCRLWLKVPTTYPPITDWVYSKCTQIMCLT